MELRGGAVWWLVGLITLPRNYFDVQSSHKTGMGEFACEARAPVLGERREAVLRAAQDIET